LEKQTNRIPASHFRGCPAAGVIALLLGLVWLTGNGCRDIAGKIDRYLRKAEKVWHFSGSVLVAVDGRVILARGYGMANVTFEEPNTPSTKFYIGSLTKTFTAAAIMKLNEEGRLSLDDPLTKYLPDYPADPGDRITIEELLTHTSGLPNYTDHPEVIFKRDQPMTPAELIDFFKNRPLEFEPGAGFEYSNSNYVLLGEIIEAASGQSYEAYLHHEILHPLGMFDSGYGRREAGHPQRADGYTLDLDRDYVQAVPIHLSVLYAAGALYSTAEDLLKWDQSLNADRILSPESIEQMLTPHAGGYGYGWVIDTLYGRKYVYHGGYLDGFNCTMDRWLDDRLCVIVLSNEDAAPVKKMARSLAAICFEQPYSEPVSKDAIDMNPSLLADYVGAYEVAAGVYRFITLSEGKLYAQAGSAPPERLLPEAPDRFFFEVDNTRTLTFVRGSDGQVESQILFDNKRRYQAVRTKLGPDPGAPPTAVSLPLATLTEYCGVYDLVSELPVDDPNYRLYVTLSRGSLYISVGNTTPILIRPHAKDEFFHELADYRVVFERNEDGQVVGCLLRMGGSEVRGVKTD